MKHTQQEGSRSVRLDADLAQLAKLAAAAARETVSSWLGAAVKQRLEREGRLPSRFKVREVSVEFEEEL